MDKLEKDKCAQLTFEHNYLFDQPIVYIKLNKETQQYFYDNQNKIK